LYRRNAGFCRDLAGNRFMTRANLKPRSNLQANPHKLALMLSNARVGV
jgi:hypothetical protein